MNSTISSNGNPFPGLRSFEREQAHLFFGRDEQISDLIERLQRRRYLPIVGVSGSGKSSLVRAGLIPNLTGSYVATETSGWRIAVLRPGRNPLHELAETLCGEFAIPESDGVLELLRCSSAGMARVAQQYLRPGEKLLVLVDQFEELFRYGDDANATSETNDAAAFVKLLLAAAGASEHPLPGFDDLPIYVVTTMRSDFLGKCSRFRGLPEALNHSQYLIPRLTREQQRDVIEGPIGMAGASIEPVLVQQLLSDLGDNPDRLPALQHALMRTWEQSAAARADGKPITVEDYDAVGRMADALNRDADRVYESLSTDAVAKAITPRIFQRLVQPGASDSETRAPTPLSELVAVTAADENDVKRVIAVFQERGFLTVSGDDDPIIDIPHESLIRGWRQLTTWVQEETRSAAIYRRLADQAALHANKEASLLLDPQLQLTLNWRERTTPNEAWAARYDSRFHQAMQFLEQSQREQIERLKQQRRNALQRFMVLVLGPLLLLAIGASIFALIQWREALIERDRSSRLLYDANIYFASNAIGAGQSGLAQQRLEELLDKNLRELRGFEWFYLWRAAHTDEATLRGHTDVVRSVVFSPDGKTVATASFDNTVKLWDTTTRRELATLSGHSSAVASVAFSPDGKTLATASYDKTVKLWATATRTLEATLRGHSLAVVAVAFSPDGKTLASSSADNTVRLWDITTRKELTILLGHSPFVLSLTFSPDGKTLAFASDSKVILWDTTTRKELAILSGHSRQVLFVAFSPDGKTLASASADDTVRLWDTVTRTVMSVLSGHSSYVLAVAFSPNGKTLASSAEDKTVKLWDTATSKELVTLSGHLNAIFSVAFSPDGQTLASASDDKTVKLWETGPTLSGHSGAVLAVAFSPDGKTLASASEDKTVKLWDTAARKELTTLFGHSDSVLSVAFSPDGKTVASASRDNTVRLWDTTTRKELATLSGYFGDVSSVAFSPDGKTLASASTDDTVKLWDTTTWQERATLSGHSGSVLSVTFSPDGKTLASAGFDAKVKLWDTSTNNELATLSGHSGSVLSIAFSPDGKTLASASYDNTVKLWDTATRTQRITLLGHLRSVWSLAFSPDGKTLASASDDNTVKLWDVTAGKELTTLSAHSSYVSSVAFSPSGTALASASHDQTIRLWLAATEAEVEARRRTIESGRFPDK